MTSRDSASPARSGRSLLLGLALLGASGRGIAGDAATGGGTSAEGAGHPYSRIPARNIFGVKPPPPPAPVEAPPEPPKERPEFFLTGLTRRGSDIRAFISFQPKGKPIEYPAALMVGVETELKIDSKESVGLVKLVSIGDDGESVQVEFNGEMLTLDFEKNAAKAVGPSGGPVAPGQPGANPNAPKGTLPPPPVPALGQLNQTVSGLQGAGAAGPTVVGRGGEVLGGFSAPGATISAPAATLNVNGSASSLPAISAGGSATSGGVSVPAVQGVIESDGATVTRRRNRDVPLPPFPSLPGN